MPNLSIGIIWHPARDRVQDAVIRLRGKGEPALANADDDGEYIFEALEPGTYNVDVFGPYIRPNAPKEVTLADKDDRLIFEEYHLINTVCEATGRKFFKTLLGLFIGLILLWGALHYGFPNTTLQPLGPQMRDVAATARAAMAQPEAEEANAALPNALHKMRQQASKVSERHETLTSHATSIEADLGVMQDSLTQPLKTLRKSVDARFKADPKNIVLKAVLDDLKKLGDSADSKTLEPIRRSLLNERLAVIEQKTDLLEKIEAETAAREDSFPIWSTKPKLYLEILFFAIFGTIVRQIMVVQRYLRFGRFYKQGLYQHIALLFTVPVLTLIFVAVLTMARLTAADSTIVLNLSDPVIVAGLSFLVALIPWRLWERLLSSAGGVVASTRQGDDDDNSKK